MAGSTKKRTLVPIAAYLEAFKEMSYSFRLNEAGDILEVNGKRLDDYELSTIRARMRARGFTVASAVEDVIRMVAAQHRYHPIKTYLTTNAMTYNGQGNISVLAAHFEDATRPYKLFETWLRRWLIGAVAKAMDGARNQNAMLVLDGPQGIGKSYFARWLCSPMGDYFLDDAINPSDKDAVIRLAMYWIWEVGELGATIRKADVEALKAFISRQVVTVRKPYGKIDMVKPALASLIGTVNNSAGILVDATGNRRFLVTTIKSIDWNYTQLDPNQIWAEAFVAYASGESWYLTKEEREQSEENNQVYRVPNPIDGYLSKYFDIDATETDPNVWTSTADIVDRLIAMGYKGSSTRSIAMEVAATLGEMGVTKVRKWRGNSGVWGYQGVQPILSTVPPTNQP
jgi:predicted P-loop ATPase